MAMFLIVFALPAYASGHAVAYTDWETFAILHDSSGNDLVVLETSRTTKEKCNLDEGCDAMLNWQITNKSNERIFWIVLGERTLTCANGYKERMAEIDIGPRILRPSNKNDLVAAANARIALPARQI